MYMYISTVQPLKIILDIPCFERAGGINFPGGLPLPLFTGTFITHCSELINGVIAAASGTMYADANACC